MTTYPDLKNEPELIKIKTKDYEIKKLNEQVDEINRQKIFDKQYNQFAIILDELKKEKTRYKKKAIKNQKQQIFNKIVGILSGISTLTGSVLTSTVLASIAGIPIASASFILTISSIILNAYLDNIKMRNRKIQDFINLTILLYEKTMKKALTDNVINEQEANELKDIYQHYLNKKDDIKKSTQFDVNTVFKDSLGDIMQKEGLSKDLINKLNDFLTKNQK